MSMSGRSDLLIRLVEMGQTEKIKEVVDIKNYDVNDEDELGNTPVMVAVQCNRVEILEYLISKNAIVPEEDNIGRNIIDYAKNRNFLKIVKLLEGIKKQKVNIEKSTELNVAKQNNEENSRSIDSQARLAIR